MSYPHVISLRNTESLRDFFEEASLESKRLNYGADEAIYEADEPPLHLYMIVSGQIRLSQGRPNGAGRLLSILGGGDWFGVMALAQVPTIGHRALAVEQSVVLRADVGRFLELLPRFPEAAIELSQSLARKVACAVDDGTGMVFDDVRRRVLKKLVALSSSAAAEHIRGGVRLRITHDQLAQAVGVARETVSLTLTQLRNQSVVKTGRNQLVFDPAILVQLLREPSAPGRPVEVN